MHLKPRDIVEFLFFGMLIAGLIVGSAVFESSPTSSIVWVAIFGSIILWIVYIAIVIHQRKVEHRRPKLKMNVNGQWVDVDTLSTPRRPVQLFDQDEAAIKHLDFNPKEKA